MELLNINELEVSVRNNWNQIRVLTSTVLKYLTAYLLLPLLILPYALQFFSPSIPNSPPFFEKIFPFGETIFIYYIYKMFLDSVFSAYGISLKKEWINYLTFKKLKIGYYKKIMHYLNIWSFVTRHIFMFFYGVTDIIRRIRPILYFVSFILILFYVCAIIWLPFQEKIVGLSVGKSLHSLISFPSLSSDLINVLIFFFIPGAITLVIIFVLAVFFLFAIIIPYECIFPVRNGIIDPSDVPISFILDAIEKLESFSFSDSFEENLNKKKQIIEEISFALENFIDVTRSDQTIACTNICFILIFDQSNKSVETDILFRTNGLYQKIEELCIKINYMKNQEVKEQIVHDLKMYLKMIEDRDLSEIQPVKFEMKGSGLSSFFINTYGVLSKIFNW